MTTIKDIAKAAGVSVTTVSRALNGYSDVNEETRKKIMNVAKELNYSPNSIARSLVMKKSKTIGILVSGLAKSSIKDNFTFEILSGVNDYIGQTDYDLVLFSTTSTKQREKTYSQLCRERQVDGVIVQGIKTDDPYLVEFLESDIPCVLIDIPLQSSSVGYVTTDNILGAAKAVQHLIDLGHKEIAMINGYDQAFVSRERRKGYQECMKKAKLPIREEWIVDGQFSEEAAERKAEELLRRFPTITALFCASDLMAFGAMKAAKKLHIDIPKQLSIVGFDDIILAEYVSPRLTTIAQDKFQMGYEAANLLIQILEDRAKDYVVMLDTQLKARETTQRVELMEDTRQR